jgi:hypothetical protein
MVQGVSPEGDGRGLKGIAVNSLVDGRFPVNLSAEITPRFIGGKARGAEFVLQ